LLGGFYAHYYASLTPTSVMHTAKTTEVLAIAYIGGRGSLWGGMLAAFPFVFVIEYLRSNLTELPGLHMVIYGALMILLMIFYPTGLAGMYTSAAKKINAVLGTRGIELPRIGRRRVAGGSSVPDQSPPRHVETSEGG
jgi:branched-chain amino acid transport system permease protein